ncbi:unnamed protein product [Musa hybrid cultivar]
MPFTPSDHASCGDLLCREDASVLAGDSPGGAVGLVEFPDESDESIAGLIAAETDYSPGFDYPDRFRSKSLDSVARQEAVAWILKVHVYYGFRPLTAYLAVNYLDRFLSSHRLPQNEWALQLLSVACLSLAAKLEETLLPSLLDLQVESAKFIFEPRTILRMELLVLNALNWRLRSVTPFAFINFFVHKIDPAGKYATSLVSRVTEITLATMKDVNFLSHRPSSLAAASIICATDEVKDLTFVNPGIAASWCTGLIEEGISDCYQSLKQVIVDITRREPPMILPQLRVTTPMNMGPNGSSCSLSLPPCQCSTAASMEWSVIQRKVGPLLWLLVISTILALFIMHSSSTFSISIKAVLTQSPLVTTNGNEEQCDTSKGKWVKEAGASIYTNLTCPTYPDINNCGKYGKDQSYLYWRWQPDSCDIPRFEPETFLNIVRGKKMAFIGDSLARNQIDSLLCLLSQAETPREVSRDSIGKYVTWYFPPHDFTLMVMWTEYFVEARPRIINGTASNSFEIHLDKVSTNWAEKLPGVDYAVLSGGNWFFRGIHLYEEGKMIGCVNCRGQNLTEFDVTVTIRRALRTALQYISSCKDCEGLVTFLRTFTSSHFENGSWLTGGYCNRTRPLNETRILLDDVAWEIRKIQLEEIERVRQQESGGKMRFGVLDVTKAMMLRADAHPGDHWTKKSKASVNDCLHWCLPGPIDMWSDLLLATLEKNFLPS